MESPPIPLPPLPLLRPPANFMTPTRLPNFTSSVSRHPLVSFYHPGYSCLIRNNEISGTISAAPTQPANSDDEFEDDVTALVFSLPAIDYNGQSHGVHHGMALAACRVIACSHSGYLTRWSPCGLKVSEPWDYVLPTGTRYYYHLMDYQDIGGGLPYPVCPSFTEWKFVRNAIPTEWVRAFNVPGGQNPIVPPSQMSTGVHTRDVSCRITDCRDSTENAHIVPRKELNWFLRNGMRLYNSNSALSGDKIIDDVRNGFLLRQDIHTAFDRAVFCLAVKEGKVVSHFLERSYEQGSLYHNSEFRLPAADPCVEFMWARFAWSILPLASVFANTPGRHLKRFPALVVRDIAVGESSSGPGSLKRRQMAADTPAEDDYRHNPPHGKRTKTTGVMTSVDTVTAPASSTSYPPSTLPSSPMPASASPHSSEFAPLSPTSDQVLAELEEDIRIKHEFFPDMDEEVDYSNSYTWQTAPFYPGQRQMERLKRRWRTENPQVGPLPDEL